MTSLAKQLQRLAIPGQPSLKQLVSRKRSSLLFDAKEAADMDVDTFYSLGQNGLEELISIDPSFAEFEDNLFQESCKEFERSVQTSEVVEQLDDDISAFLRRLSPYFLLKPAQKCLEWLIHAFRIQSYNVDSVMECILPYFETKLFARVLQLLPLKSPSSSWNWLRPLQKAGSPLSKLSLVQHCISVPSFLVFICDMVPNAIHAHQHSPPGSLRCVIALYCSTVISVLEADSGVTEEVLGRLLPYLMKGLKSHFHDYRAASYMIVGQLASTAVLEERLTISFLETITKHMRSDLGLEAMYCVGIICNTQRIVKLSKRTVKYLLRAPSLVSHLSSLSHTNDITPLLSQLLSALMNAHFAQSGSHDNSSAMETVLSILDEIPLAEKAVTQLISELLDHFVRVCVTGEGVGGDGSGEGDMEKVKTSVATLAQSLDAKYPQQMDKALQNALVTMAKHKGSKEEEEEEEEEENEDEEGRGDGDGRGGEEVKWIQEFVSLALPGSRHQVISRGKRKREREGEGEGEAGRTLVLSVHHPQSSVREAAVRQLGKALRHKSKKEEDYDAEFTSSALICRLSDEDPAVVNAVLDLGSKVLVRHLPILDLLSSLSSLLTRPHLPTSPRPWQDTAVTALQILTSPPLLKQAPDHIDDIIITSLPLLFVHRHGNALARRVAHTLFNSEAGENHPLLRGLKELQENEVWMAGYSEEADRDIPSLTAANATLINNLGMALAHADQDARRDKLVSMLLSSADACRHDSPAHFLFLGIVCVAMATDPTHSSFWLHPAQRLLQYIQENEKTLANGATHSLPSPSPTLTQVLRPLLKKHPQHQLAHALLLLWLLDTLVTRLPVVEVPKSMWLELPEAATEEQCYHRALLSLFTFLTQCIDSEHREWIRDAAKHLLHAMLKTHLSNQGYLLRFLAMIWTAPVGGMEPGQEDTTPHSHSTSLVIPATQAQSLALFSSYLRSLPPESILALTTPLCPVVPSLLIPLTSSYKAIRQQALVCISLLQQAPSQLSPELREQAYTTSPPLHLLDVLCESEATLSSDPSSVRSLLGQLFSMEREISQKMKKFESPSSSLSPSKHRVKKKAQLKARMAILEAILNGLLVQVVAMAPPPHVQSSLLWILGNVDHVLKLTATQPLLRSLLDKCSQSSNCSMETECTMGPQNTVETSQTAPHTLTSHEVEALQFCLSSLTPAMATYLLDDSDTHQSFQLLIKALDISVPLSSSVPSPQELVIQLITPAFFSSLTAYTVKIDLLNTLLNLLVTVQRSQVIVMVKQCIRKLPLTAELLVEVFNRHGNQLKVTLATPSKKRQRHSKNKPHTVAMHTDEKGLPHAWRVITVLLELVQDSCSSFSDCHLLPPHLFTLLSKCLQADDCQRTQLEYTQQLLLGALLAICEHLTRQGLEQARDLLPESQFNMELVVQCVRHSSNPLTHHHALLLLSSAASLFPSRVLHNIMPVFTFMGTSLMRHDDQYSFQVITRTLDSVIPALIQSGSSALLSPPSTTTTPHRRHRHTPRKPHPPQATPTTVEDVVTEIFRVFADAIPHVPEHRRLPLLSHLLHTVGSAQYLHVALGLLVAKHVEQLGVKEQTPKETLLETSFPVTVAHLFPPDQQLLAVDQLLSYTISLPLEKPPTVTALKKLPPAVNSLFNLATHSPKQLHQFRYSSLSLISSLLAHRVLAEQLHYKGSENMESTIHKILHDALRYETVISSEESNQKLFSSLLKKVNDITNKVTSLLPPGLFVAMVMQLLKDDGEDLQWKAMTILSNKLEGSRAYFSAEQDMALLELLGVVVGVAREDSSPLLTRQTALYCVKLIARHLQSKYHPQFISVLEEIVATLSETASLSPELAGSCLLCVAELSSSLGVQLIPLLPSVVSCVLGRVGEVKKGEEMLQVAAVTALGVIVQTLPRFLSSYINDIILKLSLPLSSQLCQPALVGGRGGKEGAQLALEASQTRQKVAISVPPHTTLPAYSASYLQLSSLGKDVTLALFTMLGHTLSSLPQQDTKTLSPQLLELFTTCLDYRSSMEELPLSEVGEVEECVVKAFTELVVKLSEATFRPMFLKLLDWATHKRVAKDRLITFYHLADGVAGKLKGLFLLFAGHMVTNIASLLKEMNKEKPESTYFAGDSRAEEKISLLLSYLLQCLHKCFLHSQAAPTSFLSQEIFDTLMPPLVDQVSNLVGGPELYQQRVEAQLGPCLTQLAVAAGKEVLWKPLNHLLLLKTRHSNAQVRYAAVLVLKGMYSQLGEEFMTLLPETIPFLAELLEDESEEVEQVTQSLLSTLESITGESIQQYFQ